MRLKALLACGITALLAASPAQAAWNLRLRATAPAASGGSGSSPVVTPGASQPSINTSTRLVSATYNNITPTSHGSSGDYGYAIRGGLRWDAIPYVEVGSPGVSATQHIGFLPWHVPTTTDMAAGLTSNISSAQVRCDGGAWSTITGPSANPDAGGQTDWNFTVTTGPGWADGLHKCDVVASPSTGPDVIANGPVSDPYGSGLESFKVNQAIISDGGVNAGTTMTVFQIVNGSDYTILNWRGSLNGSNAIGVGQSVSMMGVAPNTFISSLGTGTGRQGTYNVTGGSQLAVGAKFTGAISGTTLTVSAMTSGNLNVNNVIAGPGVTPVQITGNADFNNTFCTPNCTGHSGTGTYALGGSSQTVASETMVSSAPAVMNAARSYYFLTNYGGTLGRPTVYVSLGGSDSNAGTSSAAPFLTIGKAIKYIQTNGTASGIYGGTVCLMGGSTYSYSNFINGPWGTNGWLVYQSANQAPCSAAGDPGGATLNNAPTTSTRQYYANHVMWRYVNFNNYADNGNGGDGQLLAVDHVTEVHDTIANGGLLGSGGAYCVESTTYFGNDGACSGAMLVRGVTAKFFPNDAQHGVQASFGNTFDSGGSIFKWITGTTTIGSNVITNVTITASELSGYSLSSILAGNGNINVLIPGTTGSEAACLGGTWPLSITAINDSTHTLTVTDANSNPANATSNCTNGYLYAAGSHSDMFQTDIINPISDLFVVNNSWGATLPGWQQGQFFDTPLISGAYIVNNYWNNDPATNSHIVQTNGGAENFINGKNNYTGNNGEVFNVQQASVGDTFVQDQCPNGGFVVNVAGTNQRTKGAASSACYATAP